MFYTVPTQITTAFGHYYATHISDHIPGFSLVGGTMSVYSARELQYNGWELVTYTTLVPGNAVHILLPLPIALAHESVH